MKRIEQDTIQYFSTNLQAQPFTFSQALLKGLAPDRGLFMPERIPVLSQTEIESMVSMEYYEIATLIGSKFLQCELSEEQLLSIAKDAYNFPVPLEKVFDRNYILRLDQGPSASFKDFAARMMGRLMQHFLEKENREITILTATSGDTGSAVANAFYGLDNIKVIILFPVNEVSDRQRKQMTTLKKNISVLAVDGKFDDCQALVKKAFSDPKLAHLGLSSANSINIGRLIPQSMFYFYAYSRLASGLDDEVVFSVPSGNFGNLMGGLIAKNMGLPVARFVISTNENDEVPVFFRDHIYKVISPSKNCISSAMNVGHPSNMARIIHLYGGQMNEKGEILKEPDLGKMKEDMWSVAVDDETTRETIKKIWETYQVMLEPHGAVAWKGLNAYFDAEGYKKDQLSISLETAHPAKFPEEIYEMIGIDPELPDSLVGLDDKEEMLTRLSVQYEEFKQFLLYF